MTTIHSEYPSTSALFFLSPQTYYVLASRADDESQDACFHGRVSHSNKIYAGKKKETKIGRSKKFRRFSTTEAASLLSKRLSHSSYVTLNPLRILLIIYILSALVKQYLNITKYIANTITIAFFFFYFFNCKS